MTVIPVQYVSGATLVKLMEGFAPKPGAIRTDPAGKLLLVLGTGSERQTAVDTVRSFDALTALGVALPPTLRQIAHR